MIVDKSDVWVEVNEKWVVVMGSEIIDVVLMEFIGIFVRDGVFVCLICFDVEVSLVYNLLVFLIRVIDDEIFGMGVFEFWNVVIFVIDKDFLMIVVCELDVDECWEVFWSFRFVDMLCVWVLLFEE